MCPRLHRDEVETSQSESVALAQTRLQETLTTERTAMQYRDVKRFERFGRHYRRTHRCVLRVHPEVKLSARQRRAQPSWPNAFISSGIVW